jgi:histidinol dehydrogenase
LERKAIASEAVKKRGLIVLVRNMKEGIDLINELAPEHLEICTNNPEQIVSQIRHAGSVFIGPNTPQTLGDYVAGPSHVLPTHGSARHFSVLSVFDFIKSIPVIKCGDKSLKKLGPTAAIMARMEGMTAHAKSIELRLES